jgi:hypothetical protein
MNIFREGDEVYHYNYYDKKCKKFVLDKCLDSNNWFIKDNPDIIISEQLLSFTPYDPVTGGFSQERPNVVIKEYQLIWVRNNVNDVWKLQLYKQHFVDGTVAAYADGLFKSWKYHSITCPYDLDQPCFKK